MKKLKQLLVVITLMFGASLQAQAREIDLVDSRGEWVVYINSGDSDLPIYSWDGKPLAYLKANGGGEYLIYGYNGRHLGWYERGVIYGTDGYALCASESAYSGFKAFKPFKGFKEFRPFRSFTEFANFKPYFYSNFGSRSCLRVLLSGAN